MQSLFPPTFLQQLVWIESVLCHGLLLSNVNNSASDSGHAAAFNFHHCAFEFSRAAALNFHHCAF
ncbi:Uncharacterised protein [Cedecea neteri]|uniref:Uncharacterized protein n=1 Tax=Cedecea neteri TaxID=158822 RepID=A0A2X2SUU8_9ENTR|nr:Uncharacterised protein [Cedecea neteri]